MSDPPKFIPLRLIEVKKMTVLEQLKKLDEQRARLVTDAKMEALTKAENAISELSGLGFSYQLVEGNVKKSKTGITRKRDPNAVCTICGFATSPKNHDGRMHRNQGDKKRAFTAKELDELGLKKA
jgi:hypothetical protein